MTEVEKILDQLNRAFYGEAWHGFSLWEILNSVTAKEAAARPLEGRHSIQEIIGHLMTVKTIACQRLDGNATEPTPEEDWPTYTDSSETAWRKMLEDLKGIHKEVETRTARLSDAQLDETVPGRDYNVYFLLHGIVQHDLYHAGQIALLKRRP